VFVLQLESVNTFALFERSADAAGFRRRVPQAGLETMLREGRGVLFPFFWANSTQTHRAWEAILCGISGNAGPPISLEPARLLRRTCLPRLLGESDYARVFLYSYFEIEFFNLRGFASMAGFQDVAYGDRLMAPGDTRHEWAYDDCVFYRRAFEYLAREGLDKRERVFAYFEVGMNHWPFAGSMKHPQAHPYREPSSALEHYVNSVSEQDHCLLEFWRRFRALGRDDVHLFILPDHSLWVRGAPLAPDSGFATWLAYIPPARRAAEFKPGAVLEPVPSQAQIYPTVLELLDGTRLPGSFAFALRGEPAPRDYADCQLLSDPFQRVIVRRGDARSEYRLGSGEIALPGAPARAAGFDEFRDQFVCR
jgi:phosphoglycerol transferase MdoB-like AlkP superfamily enzyme